MCGKAVGKLFGMSSGNVTQQSVAPAATVVDNDDSASDAADSQKKKHRRRQGFDSTRSGVHTILGNLKDTLG